MKQLVIDTDIGTDVDDAFALVYALKNNNADVKAISTVIGDTVIRAKITRKLEQMLGVNIPIITGGRGLEESVRKYWTGIEKMALNDLELNEPILSTSYPDYNEESRLVCLGPLTNIKYQLLTKPTIKYVKEVYVMGSSDSSHNFKADIDAKNIVFGETWNIYQITKDVSEKISFTKEELKSINKNPIGEFLYESAIRWLDHVNKGWIDHLPQTSCAMYDVLTVSVALGEPYVKFNQISDNRFISTDVDLELKDKIKEAILK